MNTFASSKHNRERGIAMFFVMFALLFLSVIGLGMMYSTNTETAINANYKDSQIAMYGSLAGLYEARDRIQPAGTAPFNIAAPAAEPSLSAANVIYVINPRSGETIAPWDTTNRFFDWELCQEKVMGLTGTFGIPCTTIPTGSSWRSVVDNTQSSSAPFNISVPTDMKWTRITVKTNTMTPVPANGNAGISTQVCWDGHHQIVRPPGYGSNCWPDGSIASLILQAPGTGYTGIPTVTISAPPTGGIQATADAVTALVTNGMIQSITLDNPGAGYLVPPTVTISGAGSGATATATIVPPDYPVASISLTSAGSQCYSVPPPVTISGGAGLGAAATATLSTTPDCVVSWNPAAHCTTTPPKNTTVTDITLSGGTGFSGTAVFNSGGHITSFSIQNPGSGYTSNPTTAGGGTPALGSCVVTPNAIVGYKVNGVTLTSGGGGFTTPPTVLFGTGAGTSATPPTATATLGAMPGNAGQVTAINLLTSGSGYVSGTTVVTITGTATTNAQGTAVVGTNYSVTGLTLTNPGKGYISDPTVTITGGGGSGATAKAKLSRGPQYGMVYMLTSLAQTQSGGRAMTQMEVSSPVLGFGKGGALTLDGPSPVIGTFPNSTEFYVKGQDQNSCGEIAEPDHPAIEGYDDPNADPPTHSVQTIISELPRPDHYTGAGGIPSVQNGFEALGETMGTPTGLKALIDSFRTQASLEGHLYGNNPSSIFLGTASDPMVSYVEGDLTMNGGPIGYGILVVTGTLRMGGDFRWYGPIFVVGDGVAEINGGGNAEIIGLVWVAKIWDSYATLPHPNLLNTVGSPSFTWDGGGGNGITYDHCWAENLVREVPFSPPPSTKPLKILSTRTIP